MSKFPTASSALALLLILFVIGAKQFDDFTYYPYSKLELREIAFQAKQSFALGGVLDVDTRLDEALDFDFQQPNLQEEIFSKINTHPFHFAISAPTYSMQYWVPRTSESVFTIDASPLEVCKNNPQRAAEVLLFYDAKACPQSPLKLLKKPTTTFHKLLLFALQLLNGTEYKLVLPDLFKLAHDSNHPIAHIMLARILFEEKGECLRSAIHLTQAIHAISHLLVNMHTSAPDHTRLSRLMDDTNVIQPFTSREEFEEYQVHLQGLVLEFPDYSLHLADLYATGAPDLGIPPDYSRASDLYATTMSEGGEFAGQAATSLASLALYDAKFTNQSILDMYEFALEQDEPSAYLGLGAFYRDGNDVVLRDVDRAKEYFTKAALAGYAEGDFQLSKLLGNNTYLLRAADNGHVLACAEYGEHLLRTAKCEAAMPYLLKAIRSDWTMELPFDSPRGAAAYVRGDTQLALNIYSLARIMLWQTEAIMNEAFLLEQRNEVVASLTLYRTAALKWKIGEAYRKLGEHCDDVAQAAFWFRLGSQHGDAESAYRIGVLRHRGGVTGLTKLDNGDFDNAIELDPAAWWVVHVYEIWTALFSWWV